MRRLETKRGRRRQAEAVPTQAQAPTMAPPSRSPPQLRASSDGPPAPRRASDPAMLGTLDDDQRAAAEAAEGPLLIVAGPGLRQDPHADASDRPSDRRARRCRTTAASPSRSPAAPRPRCASGWRACSPATPGGLPIHTFHSLGLAILREHAGAAGLHPDFRVAGEAERIAAAGRGAGRLRAQGRAAAARDLARQSATPGGREHRRGGGDVAPIARALRDAQLDRLRRSRRARRCAR